MTTNGIAMAEEQQMEQEFQTEEGSRGADEPMETEDRTDNFDKYLGMGFPEKVAAELDKFLVKEILQDDELDERALEALKELDETSSLGVLKQFSESDLSHVNNKSAFLCGVIKAYRQKSRLKQGTPSTTETTSKGPDEAKVKEILERTGYSLDVTTGQRKYGGPPPNWEGDPPVTGSEVFMGKIPRDLFEDSLIPLVEKCGTVYDLRLMMDPISGQNRGYAFVTFTDREGAKEAVKQLNGHKIKDGWQINVNISIPKSRLYIGSIPKTKSKEEIKEEFDKHTSGLMDVIIYHSEDKKKNRGFAFLEYDSHKSASLARRKMMSGRIKIWNNIAVNVDWADPIVEPDNDTMEKVKVVYIRNLTVDATEEKIKEHFTQFGAVERVKKMKDYCFVHFNERECALKAIEETHEKEYEGSTIEVSLAKPPQDNKEKKKRQMRGGFGGGFEYGGQGFSPRGRGGMMPHRGRGGFGGNRFQDYGGYGMDDYYYGGDYGGGYGDYYDEFGYDRGYGYGGYGGGPRGRGGMRGGRGGPRGGGMRGGPRGGGMRGGPRGGGMRGAPRGGRGGQRGGRGGRGGNIGGKRKFEGSQQMDTKRRNTQGGQWGAQPIAQQPLDQQSYGYDYNSGYGKDSWSSDNYGSGWN